MRAGRYGCCHINPAIIQVLFLNLNTMAYKYYFGTNAKVFINDDFVKDVMPVEVETENSLSEDEKAIALWNEHEQQLLQQEN
jgi:hypothetical protein